MEFFGALVLSLVADHPPPVRLLLLALEQFFEGLIRNLDFADWYVLHNYSMIFVNLVGHYHQTHHKIPHQEMFPQMAYPVHLHNDNLALFLERDDCFF
jgi:hypothetical protein